MPRRRTLRNRLLAAACLLVVVGCAASRARTETPLEAGERIVFFGDSITQSGAQPGGYVSLVADSLARRFPTLGVEVIGAGISGNKIADLLARVDRDVIARDPSIVVVYIGINDVWHWKKPPGRKGSTPEEFESGLRTLASKLEASGARVVLCTPSVIGERPQGQNELDAQLDRYAEITRTVAREAGAPVCDLRADFLSYLRTHNPDDLEQGVLTTDGVHLNPAGNRFVADRMLAALLALRDGKAKI